MPSFAATAFARLKSREAIASTVPRFERCIPGMTFPVPIRAVEITPHRIVRAICASPQKQLHPETGRVSKAPLSRLAGRGRSGRGRRGAGEHGFVQPACGCEKPPVMEGAADELHTD